MTDYAYDDKWATKNALADSAALKVVDADEFHTEFGLIETAVNTKSLKIPTGGLFTPRDKHSLPKTSALPTPKGSIKRKIDDDPKVSKETLKAIWDAERQRLLDLVAKRNKEHGVIL